MNENKELNLLLSKMELHLEEEIEFVNEICSDNFTSYDNETIMFYLSLRELFKQYKKELRKLSKEIEKRKDTL